MAAKGPLKEFGTDPVSEKNVAAKEGRFGVYVTDGETNASLGKGDRIEEVSPERAYELLAIRRERSSPRVARRARRRRRRRRRPLPRRRPPPRRQLPRKRPPRSGHRRRRQQRRPRRDHGSQRLTRRRSAAARECATPAFVSTLGHRAGAPLHRVRGSRGVRQVDAGREIRRDRSTPFSRVRPAAPTSVHVCARSSTTRRRRHVARGPRP